MKAKRCSKCKETKPVSEFHRNRTAKDGLHYECKPCNKGKVQRYYEANKEKVAEYQRRYREANKEKIAETSRRRYEANREQEIERSRRWRESNREQENRKNRKRQREVNYRSSELAHKQKQPWEDWEEEFVMADNGLTQYQKAVKLGRSLYSVRSRLYRLRKSARAELVHND